MSTDTTWKHLGTSGGDQVAQRLSNAGVPNALAERVRKGRHRRGLMHVSASVAAVGGLGLGAWTVAPVWTSDADMPAGQGVDIHVDGSVPFIGSTTEGDMGPHFFACGSEWEAPVLQGVTVPAVGAPVPQLGAAVYERTIHGDARLLVPGDTVSIESFPAVLTYVSWPDSADAPDSWQITSTVALVDGDGNVVAVGYEPPADWIDPVGRAPLAGEVMSHVDMHLNFCVSQAADIIEGDPLADEPEYLEGTFTLHVVTQVFSTDDSGAHEVLATFADYGGTEPFTVTVDASSARDSFHQGREAVEEARAYLAELIVDQGVTLRDATTGVRPIAGQCERVEAASRGLALIDVLEAQVPDFNADFIIDDEVVAPWLGEGVIPGLWLVRVGDDVSQEWWSGYPVTFFLYDQGGTLVASMVTDGSSLTPTDRDLTVSALRVDGACTVGSVAPGTYDVVAVTTAPFGNTSWHFGYNAGYETWVHLEEVQIPSR